MIDRIRTKQANDEGFTLVEMLIVIVVLGILAGITVFGVSTFRSDAEASACSADLKTVQVAAEAYRAKTGNAATAITDLTTVPASAPAGTQPYLKTTPKGTYSFAAGNATQTAC